VTRFLPILLNDCQFSAAPSLKVRFGIPPPEHLLAAPRRCGIADKHSDKFPPTLGSVGQCGGAQIVDTAG
jgi:hypothetical protein